MWPIIGSIAVCLISLCLDFPKLWTQKRYKEMVLFVIFMTAALCIYIMNVLYVPIPNPLDGIAMLIERLGGAIG